MDDTFSFSAPAVPLRRRTDPRAIKLALVGLVLLSGLVVFARWVIQSEHRSEAQAASIEADDASAIGLIGGQSPVANAVSNDPSILDVPARSDARTALAAAREAARGRATLADAGPGELSSVDRSLVFTDGPSPAPGIVSVATDGERWSAAVMGESGTCYWLRLGPEGLTYGTGSVCTGVAAMASDDDSWGS
jgi:hypothetical protein